MASETTKHISEQSPAELKAQQPFPPCRAACPVNTDIQAYVGYIAEGKYAESIDVIRSVNPIASACSVICHHPCEQQCRRCNVDDPLAIRHLKRFALEQAADYRKAGRRAVPKTKTKSIGIIGSGPSGLTAASDLANLGYKVTIYEKNPDLGGMLSAAIPTYRLPRQSLMEDIQDVISKGVDVKTGVEIGKDISFDDLAKQHDATLIAVGLSLSRSLPIPGVEGPGVLLALPFLFNANYGQKMELGDNVLVIGGGNVAMDVARTARRLGVKKVEMACLENEQEMPAWKWEVEEALDEGIKIHHRKGPKSVQRDASGKVTGLEVVKVTSVFDAQGRFSPTFDESQKTVIAAQTIIITIGQMSNLAFLKGTKVSVDERGRLGWDQATQMSSAQGVFVSGEVVTGPGSAIQAVASGHRAAKAISLYLEGKNIAAGITKEEKEKISELPQDVITKIHRQKRSEIKVLPAETRCATFELIEAGYDEVAALKEASRCRGCGSGAMVDQDLCMACLTCMRVCPYGAPTVTNKSSISPVRCQACGLCAPECPSQAIRMAGYDVREIVNSMPGLIGKPDASRKAPLMVAFQCTNHPVEGGISVPENVRRIAVPCASRIGAIELLKVFELGADGAFVVMCEGEGCKHPTAPARVKARVEQVKGMLTAMGLGGERLGVFAYPGERPKDVLAQAYAAMAEKSPVRK